MGGWFYRNRDRYPKDWDEIARQLKEGAGWQCEVCGAKHGPPPQVLTVHHIDFDPSHIDNLIVLCQRCHLKAQAMSPQPKNRRELLNRMKPRGKQLSLLLSEDKDCGC